MKDYKVVEAKNSHEAEKIMNEMAVQGWNVKAVTYWMKWTYRLIITLERDKEF